MCIRDSIQAAEMRFLIHMAGYTLHDQRRDVYKRQLPWQPSLVARTSFVLTSAKLKTKLPHHTTLTTKI